MIVFFAAAGFSASKKPDGAASIEFVKAMQELSTKQKLTVIFLALKDVEREVNNIGSRVDDTVIDGKERDEKLANVLQLVADVKKKAMQTSNY